MPLKFGTSGLRGLVEELTDEECFLFTRAFINHTRSRFTFDRVSVAGDFRSSTPRILEAVAEGIRAEGILPQFCGFIATPAVTFQGIVHGNPSIMVTGSHIPDDRNGLKFAFPVGEVLKKDEPEILRYYHELKTAGLHRAFFDASGHLPAQTERALPPVDPGALEAYRRRYLEAFPEKTFAGRKLVVYQHSSVSRDLLCELLDGLGAEVIVVGRSEEFIPVDTEAVGNQDQLAGWVKEFSADALLSTDGDGDRPLLVDDRGRLVRGDVLGLLVARFLRAGAVALPVSCSSILEKSGWVPRIERTRIGSPFVIEGMNRLVEEGYRPVVGYEANGGFLLATEARVTPRLPPLVPLPTRDAVLPLLSILALSVSTGRPLSNLRASLPAVFTYSGILREFPSDAGVAIMRLFREGGLEWADEVLGGTFGPLQSLDLTDGARVSLTSGEVVHLRPSGNAPEFRCYTEAASEARAVENNRLALEIVERRLVKLVS